MNGPIRSSTVALHFDRGHSFRNQFSSLAANDVHAQYRRSRVEQLDKALVLPTNGRARVRSEWNFLLNVVTASSALASVNPRCNFGWQ